MPSFSAKIRHMALPGDLRDQLDKLDQQIIELLAERLDLVEEAQKNDEEGLSSSDVNDIVAEWEEIADEKAWNVPAMGRIARGVSDLCKPSGE
jgi:chorismate mutase